MHRCPLVVVLSFVRFHPTAPVTAQAIGAAARTVRTFAFLIQVPDQVIVEKRRRS